MRNEVRSPRLRMQRLRGSYQIVRDYRCNRPWPFWIMKVLTLGLYPRCMIVWEHRTTTPVRHDAPPEEIEAAFRSIGIDAKVTRHGTQAYTATFASVEEKP